MNKIFYTFIIVLFSTTILNAQEISTEIFSKAKKSFIDEWEVSVGYVNFQGDFGQRGYFETTLGNSGGVLGVKVYLNFLDPDRIQCYSCAHLKFNVSLNTGYSALSYGTAYKSSDFVALKSLSGYIYFVDLGMNMEYHLSDLKNRKFLSNGFLHNFDPYFGFGFGGMYYNVDVESSLGNFETNPTIVPDALAGRIHNGNSFVPALNAELGLRYRFSEFMQFVFNNKWKYFFSDDVDGINPNPAIVDNKYNDWFFTPSLGVVIFVK